MIFKAMSMKITQGVNADRQEARSQRHADRHQQEEPAKVSEELPGREEGAPRGVLESAKKVFRGGGSQPVCQMLQKGQLG